MPAQRPRKARPRSTAGPETLVPPQTDWRTTDEQEIARRQVRAREELFRIRPLGERHPIFTNFEVRSESGMIYQVEIRDLTTRHFSCTCRDFRINGLGTCKHVEATLLHLGRRQRASYKAAQRIGSPCVDILPSADGSGLRIERNANRLPSSLKKFFDETGQQRPGADPIEILQSVRRSSSKLVRISQETTPWLAARERALDTRLARRDFEKGVAEGRYPEHVTLSPLFPYQREGMLHLAFKERALLADEMGLGKTIQAIAAAALLQRMGKAGRTLVVTPASLKTEWEEQINRFTSLGMRLIYGARNIRRALYSESTPPFFTIVNYEQVLADSLEINRHLAPDIVILDEAQRIKNWATKTAQAVKRLESRYAFVLTGTPIENRIDELRSLVDFLDPTLFGPLFRFNREYYALDERGRPTGYRNLTQLRERVRPILLRRRKSEVETELPGRTDKQLFVNLTKTMWDDYRQYEETVQRLAAKARKRALTPNEQQILMLSLNCMRMICDSPGLIKNNPSTECPKMEELARVLDELLANEETKVIVFSEWTGMLERVRLWAVKNHIGHAWHTGTVDQRRRRAEINAFRTDPDCRLFLSTDSGGVGLNLQNASVVINCDLPWNPAKLEQRIARAWRKGQMQPVTVINLIAEKTIEHGMVETLAHKSLLSASILDGADAEDVPFKSGAQAFLKRLEQVLATGKPTCAPALPAAISDPALHFAKEARRLLGGDLIHCEETYAPGRELPILLAVLRAPMPRAQKALLEKIHAASGWASTSATLQVLDTTAWGALQTLAENGIIAIHTRARRPLLPTDAHGSPALTPEQLARIATLHELVSRKRRAATALEAAGLPEEAAPHIQAAEKAEKEAAQLQTGGVCDLQPEKPPVRQG